MIWSVVHDFMYGYGYQSGNLMVFASEVKYYLGKDLFIEAPSENNIAVDSEKVQTIFNEVKVHLNNVKPSGHLRETVQFNKINIPSIKQPFPKLPW